MQVNKRPRCFGSHYINLELKVLNVVFSVRTLDKPFTAYCHSFQFQFECRASGLKVSSEKSLTRID